MPDLFIEGCFQHTTEERIDPVEGLLTQDLWYPSFVDPCGIEPELEGCMSELGGKFRPFYSGSIGFCGGPWYGCSDLTTGKALPKLYLGDYADLQAFKDVCCYIPGEPCPCCTHLWPGGITPKYVYVRFRDMEFCPGAACEDSDWPMPPTEGDIFVLEQEDDCLWRARDTLFGGMLITNIEFATADCKGTLFKDGVEMKRVAPYGPSFRNWTHLTYPFDGWSCVGEDGTDIPNMITAVDFCKGGTYDTCWHGGAADVYAVDPTA